MEKAEIEILPVIRVDRDTIERLKAVAALRGERFADLRRRLYSEEAETLENLLRDRTEIELPADSSNAIA